MHEIKEIARLAKISLEPAEEELLRVQLSRVLEYVHQLVEFDDAHGPLELIEAAQLKRSPASLSGDEQAWIEDRQGVEASRGAARTGAPGISQQQLLANAPAHQEEHLAVPPVLGVPEPRRRERSHRGS